MTDIDREIRTELDRVRVPELAPLVLRRIAEPAHDDVAESAGLRSRLATVAIAFTVFAGGALLAWMALRPAAVPGGDGSSVVFPTWSSAARPAAIVRGMLMERDGCLLVDTGHGEALVLWERGYGYADGAILGSDGDVVVRIGQGMMAGGGFGDSRSWAEEITATSIPDRCIPAGAEPFALAYDVVAVEAVPVPDVVGLRRAEAIEMLEMIGLEAGASLAPSDEVPEGAVLSQEPAAGTTAAVGTGVSFVVSKGPTPAGDDVPVGDLPEAGIAVTSSDGVDLIELDGSVIRSLPGYNVAGNPGAHGVWLRAGNRYFELNGRRSVLVAVPTSVARSSMYDEGPPPQLGVPTAPAGGDLAGN